MHTFDKHLRMLFISENVHWVGADTKNDIYFEFVWIMSRKVETEYTCKSRSYTWGIGRQRSNSIAGRTLCTCIEVVMNT